MCAPPNLASLGFVCEMMENHFIGHHVVDEQNSPLDSCSYFAGRRFAAGGKDHDSLFLRGCGGDSGDNEDLDDQHGAPGGEHLQREKNTEIRAEVNKSSSSGEAKSVSGLNSDTGSSAARAMASPAVANHTDRSRVASSQSLSVLGRISELDATDSSSTSTSTSSIGALLDDQKSSIVRPSLLTRQDSLNRIKAVDFRRQYDKAGRRTSVPLSPLTPPRRRLTSCSASPQTWSGRSTSACSPVRSTTASLSASKPCFHPNKALRARTESKLATRTSTDSMPAQSFPGTSVGAHTPDTSNATRSRNSVVVVPSSSLPGFTKQHRRNVSDPISLLGRTLSHRLLHPSGQAGGDPKSDSEKSMTGLFARNNLSNSLVLQYSVRHLAEELALIDGEQLRKIRMKELQDCRWIKKNKEELAPNIVSMVNAFNRVALAVATEILSQPTPQVRAQVIMYFIKLAVECRILCNFNSLRAILGGLQCAAVYRLSQTWKEVSTRRKKQFKKLSTIMSEEENFATYRQSLETALETPPCVPFLGVFLSKVVQMEAYQSERSKTSSSGGPPNRPARTKVESRDSTRGACDTTYASGQRQQPVASGPVSLADTPGNGSTSSVATPGDHAANGGVAATHPQQGDSHQTRKDIIKSRRMSFAQLDCMAFDGRHAPVNPSSLFDGDEDDIVPGNEQSDDDEDEEDEEEQDEGADSFNTTQLVATSPAGPGSRCARRSFKVPRLTRGSLASLGSVPSCGSTSSLSSSHSGSVTSDGAPALTPESIFGRSDSQRRHFGGSHSCNAISNNDATKEGRCAAQGPVAPSIPSPSPRGGQRTACPAVRTPSAARTIQKSSQSLHDLPRRGELCEAEEDDGDDDQDGTMRQPVPHSVSDDWLISSPEGQLSRRTSSISIVNAGLSSFDIQCVNMDLMKNTVCGLPAGGTSDLPGALVFDSASDGSSSKPSSREDTPVVARGGDGSSPVGFAMRSAEKLPLLTPTTSTNTTVDVTHFDETAADAADVTADACVIPGDGDTISLCSTSTLPADSEKAPSQQQQRQQDEEQQPEQTPLPSTEGRKDKAAAADDSVSGQLVQLRSTIQAELWRYQLASIYPCGSRSPVREYLLNMPYKTEKEAYTLSEELEPPAKRLV